MIRNLLFLIFIIDIFFITGCKQEQSVKINTDSLTNLENQVNQENKEFTVIGVGDIMMGSTYPLPMLPPKDGSELFKDVKDILTDADITFGNLEGPLLDEGGTPKKCGETSDNCYSFRMPERYGEHLKDAGFDFLNLANNHAGDMGIKGRESTYKTLTEYDIKFAGTIDYPTAIIEIKNVKFGLVGFAPNRGTLNLNDIETANAIVKELKSKVDFVIVSIHGGAEGAGAQHVTKTTEIGYGENRGNVYKFAHNVIDAGADIVFGHGPHVTRAVELYNNKFIAYSLGNFCTYGKFSLYGVQGIAPIIKVYIDKNGDFIKAEVTSIKQINRGFPVIDEKNTAFKTIKQLTISDFYDTPLKFESDYLITKSD